MSLLTVLIIAFIALAVALPALYLLARKRPQAFAPLLKLALRSKRVQRMSAKKAAAELAANPELLTDEAEGLIGRDAARQLGSVLEGRSEAERERIMGQVLEAANSGRPVDPSILRGKPGSGARTADQLRSRNKAKSKSRAKAKQARRQRKQNRRKRR